MHMTALPPLHSVAVPPSTNTDGASKVAKMPIDMPDKTSMKLLPFRQKNWTLTPGMGTTIHQDSTDQTWITVSRCKFLEARGDSKGAASEDCQPKATVVTSLMEAGNKLFLILLLLCQVYTAEEHNALSNDDEMWRFYDKALAWELKRRRPNWMWMRIEYVRQQEELSGQARIALRLDGC